MHGHTWPGSGQDLRVAIDILLVVTGAQPCVVVIGGAAWALTGVCAGCL